MDIHGTIIHKDGIRIAGFGGSHKYKDKNYPLFTQEESKEIAASIKEADILLSHTSPKGLYGTDDIAHIGLEGISDYINNNDVKLNIHGHFHEDSYTVMEDGTVVIGVCGAVIIHTSDYSVRKIF